VFPSRSSGLEALGGVGTLEHSQTRANNLHVLLLEMEGTTLKRSVPARFHNFSAARVRCGESRGAASFQAAYALLPELIMIQLTDKTLGIHTHPGPTRLSGPTVTIWRP
jgi:hypothetical protein